jgi:hypothetical protein
LAKTKSSLQHAEPSLEEFLPVKVQQELEEKQREEEDALYRKFLQVRLHIRLPLGFFSSGCLLSFIII